MKTVLLIRHSKAEKGPMFKTDKERPLKKKGHEDAYRIGSIIEHRKYAPELLLTSSALRARQTAKEVLQSCHSTQKVDNRIYNATVLELIEVIQGVDEEISSVGIVGHNPTLFEAVLETGLTITSLGTSSAALISFPVETWSEVQFSKGSVEEIMHVDDAM